MDELKGIFKNYKPSQKYSEAFKRAVVKEFEEGSISKEFIQDKYGLGGNSVLLNWCCKYGKFSTLTQEHIDMLSDHLILDLEWSMNTHAKFMMDLLQMFKYAVKLKKLPPAILTELKFDTSREETDAIYLTMDQVREMYGLKKFDLPEQEVVRDMFVIGCFTGMRFSDYSLLDPSAIRNNRLSFIQVKIGAKVTIPIQ